jgi:hypothetical protein
MSETPERIWVGTDGRDYHPVFLTENAAKEHGWNDADDADAPEYIRKDLSDAAVDAEREACAEIATLEAENFAYVVENDWCSPGSPHDRGRQECGYKVSSAILARGSTDALAERDARIRAEALREAAEKVGASLRHIESCLMFPVSTEINKRGYDTRTPTPETVEYMVSEVHAAQAAILALTADTDEGDG